MKKCEERLGYFFRDPALLTQALRHSSYSHEKYMDRNTCNERLEFLGDAVLELVSSEFLYKRFPEKPEGELSKLRSALVCEASLAYCARELSLEQDILLGKGEELCGGRNRDSIISDALEAVIGAIFLDGGITNAKGFVLQHVLNDIEHKQLFSDSKTILQELVQKNDKGEISYHLVGEEGPDHAKIFLVELTIDGIVMGHGRGQTKKKAEQQAAYEALMTMKKQEG